MPESDVSLLEEGVKVVGDEGFSTVDKVVPHLGKMRTDFNSLARDKPKPVPYTMDAEAITTFKSKWWILGHIEMVSAGKDIVHLHRPGYCAFYVYPFVIGYMLPLPSLVVDFCHYYGVCPTQLSLYAYKLFFMLIKYAELAGREISLGHMLLLFASHFLRGMMIHMLHRGTKDLVVKMDDKADCCFWESYFYV